MITGLNLLPVWVFKLYIYILESTPVEELQTFTLISFALLSMQFMYNTLIPLLSIYIYIVK